MSGETERYIGFLARFVTGSVMTIIGVLLALMAINENPFALVYQSWDNIGYYVMVDYYTYASEYLRLSGLAFAVPVKVFFSTLFLLLGGRIMGKLKDG